MSINAIQGDASVVAEKINRQNIILLKHNMSVYGLDIGHVMTMDYNTSRQPLGTTEKEEEVNTLRS